jgi:hypothetical protein
MPALRPALGPADLVPLLEAAGVAARVIVQTEESLEVTVYISGRSPESSGSDLPPQRYAQNAGDLYRNFKERSRKHRLP